MYKKLAMMIFFIHSGVFYMISASIRELIAFEINLYRRVNCLRQKLKDVLPGLPDPGRMFITWHQLTGTPAILMLLILSDLS